MEGTQQADVSASGAAFGARRALAACRAGAGGSARPAAQSADMLMQQCRRDLLGLDGVGVVDALGDWDHRAHSGNASPGTVTRAAAVASHRCAHAFRPSAGQRQRHGQDPAAARTVLPAFRTEPLGTEAQLF